MYKYNKLYNDREDLKYDILDIKYYINGLEESKKLFPNDVDKIEEVKQRYIRRLNKLTQERQRLIKEILNIGRDEFYFPEKFNNGIRIKP